MLAVTQQILKARPALALVANELDITARYGSINSPCSIETIYHYRKGIDHIRRNILLKTDLTLSEDLFHLTNPNLVIAMFQNHRFLLPTLVPPPNLLVLLILGCSTIASCGELMMDHYLTSALAATIPLTYGGLALKDINDRYETNRLVDQALKDMPKLAVPISSSELDYTSHPDYHRLMDSQDQLFNIYLLATSGTSSSCD